MNYLSQQNSDDFSGKRVLVRLDVNVPVSEDGTIRDSDANRIEQSQQTLNWLKESGARIVIISHLGRDAESLAPVAKYMDIPLINWEQEYDGTLPIVMLENLRQNPGEESNDEAFAKKLASYGDCFVNDAFAVSHRAHASIVGVPKLLPSYAGFQLEQEMNYLHQALHPEHPSILIMGGAKFETKLPVITKFLNIVDHVMIGGALVNNVYRAQGYEIGKSLVDESADISGIAQDERLMIPEQVIIENDTGKHEKNITEVESGDKIVDIAPKSFEKFQDIFSGAKYVIWNGPMGNYENGFTNGTEQLIQVISQIPDVVSIVGGGDSIALIEQLGMQEKFSFLSTGGGAMLEYLAQGTLPGIDALG